MKNFLFSSNFMYLSVLVVIGINVFVCPDLLSHPDMKLNDLSYLTYDSKFVKELNSEINKKDNELNKPELENKQNKSADEIEVKTKEEVEEKKEQLGSIVANENKIEAKSESEVVVKEDSKNDLITNEIKETEIQKTSDEKINDNNTKDEKEIVNKVDDSSITTTKTNVESENVIGNADETKKNVDTKSKVESNNKDNVDIKEAIENVSFFSGCKFNINFYLDVFFLLSAASILMIIAIVNYHNNNQLLKKDFDDCQNIDLVDYVSDMYINPSKYKFENNSDYSLIEDDSTAFEY